MKKLEKWLKGLLAAFIGGAVTTITNIVIDPVAFNLQDQLKKTLMAALIAGGLAVCFYLKQAPLPPDEETTEEAE